MEPKQKEKIEKATTGELLEMVRDNTLDDDVNLEIWSELMDRPPFNVDQEKIEEIEKAIQGMQVAIDKLKRHKHTQDGDAVVSL